MMKINAILFTTFLLISFSISCTQKKAKEINSDPSDKAVSKKSDSILVCPYQCFPSPSFPRGEDSLLIFLRENTRYPEESRKNGIQGTVWINFLVNLDGKISDVKVMRGIGSELDEEAIRVVKLMPNWIPAKQQGKPIPTYYNLPIKFKLVDSQ